MARASPTRSGPDRADPRRGRRERLGLGPREAQGALASSSVACASSRSARRPRLNSSEKKHRVEDAVAATRAAVEEGIVAGGGSVLIHAAAQLDEAAVSDPDEAAGIRIVKRALTSPLYWIAANAGFR